MAVQETAISCGKGRSAGCLHRPNGIASAPTRAVLKSLARGSVIAVLTAWGMQPFLSLAQVSPAPGASPANRPAVGQAPNGVPLVQITTPNAAGVSNNLFSQYNVGPNGLILNNSPSTTQTQLGGYVAGNPYLATGSAHVIVNQVVGGSPSQLLGYTEVAGSQAQVVIANPSGIYCNGCGFINTSRTVLTTGMPIFGGTGSLDALHVTGGQIQIGSAGFNGNNIDQVDLIARNVQINGNVWAGKQLNVVAGANDVSYSDLSTRALPSDGNSPGVAIDVSQLGGMYAGKITLVGTEAGVGVNSLGTIQAQSGDIQLSSAGKVTLAGSASASGNVQIRGAGDISNSGAVYAAQNANVSSQGQLTNSGTFASLGSTTIGGASIASTGAVGAGIDSNGHVSGTGNLTLDASGAVASTGQNLAGGNVAISGSSVNLTGSQTQVSGSAMLTATGAGGSTGDVTQTHASVGVGGTLGISAAGGFTNDQAQASAGQFAVTAASLSNHGGQIVQTGTSQGTFAVTGDIDNTQGTIQIAGAASLAAANVTNAAGRIVSLNSDGLTVHASGTITNAAGTTAQGTAGGVIGGNGNVAVQSSSLTNSGTVTAGQTLNATVNGLLDNSNGAMSGAAVTANAASLKNAHGAISGSTVSLTIPQLDNSSGQITANQLTIGSTNYTNEHGTLTQLGTGPMSMTVSNAIDNSNGGVIQTNSQDLTLTPASLNNNGGTITHAGTGALTIAAANGTGAFANASGTVTSNGAISVAAGGIQNEGGVIASGKSLTVTTGGDMDNTQGTLQAGGAASLTAANVINAAGRIVSLNSDGLTVEASGTITNAAGTTAQGTAGGVIGGNGNVAVQSSSLTNSGTVTAGQTLNATVNGLLDNSNGAMSGAAVTANAASLKNAHGAISGSTVSLTIPQLDNSSGQITANQLTIGSTNYTNEHGTLTQLGTGPMSMTVSNAIDNSNGGVIQTNSQDLTLTPASLNNNGGTITHAGTGVLTIRVANGTGALTNVSGKIVTNGQASIAAGSLDDTGGTAAARGAMSIATAGPLINNTGGLLHSDTSLAVTSGAGLTNVGGQINVGTAAGAGDASTLRVTAASIDNTNGSIVNVGSGATTVSGTSQIVNSNAGGVSGMGSIGGNGTVTLTTATLSNTQGGQLSGANLLIDSGTLNNTGGLIGNAANTTGDIGISASGIVYNGSGQISAARNLSLTANTLSGGGAFNAAGDATVNLQGNFTNALGYQFNAGNNLTFNLPGWFSNGGNLVAFNNLTINAGNIGNAGSIIAGGLLKTTSATLTNVGALVGASVSLNASQAISNLGTSALIGATDSAGLLEVLAPDIENRDDTTASDTPAQTMIYGLGRVALAGGKDANGNYTKAGLITNQSAVIQSDGDMLLAANLVNNTRRVVSTSGFTSSVDPNLLASLGISLSGRTGQIGVADPNSIGGVYIDPPHGGQWNSTYEFTTYTGVAIADTVTSISPKSQVIAGGNLYASSVDTFQNYWSQVAAAGSIANPVNLDQQSWRGQTAPKVQVTYSGEYHYNNYDNSEYDWQLPFGDAGFVTGTPGGYTQKAPADVRTYALPGYESTWVSNGAITGTGGTINNTGGNAGVTPLGLAPGQTLSATNVFEPVIRGTPGNNLHIASTSGAAAPVSGAAIGTPDPIIGNATALSVLTNLSVPQGGLFKPDTAPNAPYLVETNPAFTNLHQWLSSDYYFQQMGMDPGLMQMRLGDGFYEQHLVQSQIMSLTGKAVLTNYADTQSEFQALMTSGAALAKQLNLAPGMALSSQQVAGLTNNVVIMQTEIVDGKSVLVPVVYLAKASQENMGNGPVIAATDIDLENTQGITNSGTIRATNSLTLTGKSIDSAFGTLQSGGLATLATTGDINLTSATVNAGSLALQAGGNLTLDTAVKTFDQVSSTGATRVTNTLGPAASIDVKGDAAIVTGGNFEQNAGALNVGGTLGMSIGGNWILGAQQTGETKSVERANGVSNTHFVSDTGSSVKVGGASTIGVAGDLTATGATMKLGGGGTIVAGGNVNLQAAVATSTIDSNSSGSDSHGSYAETLHTSDDAVTATSLTGGDNLNVVAGKDINVTGSSIELDKGKLQLAATGNVNIGAVTETHTFKADQNSSHGGFGSSTQKTDHIDQTTTLADGSAISADSVSVSSGKDLNVTGSSIVGTSDVALSAKGNINITAATDTYQDTEYHDVKHSGFSGTGGIGISYGSSETKDNYNETSVTQSQSRSTIGSVAGNVSIVSGNDVHIGGSDVIAAKAQDDTTGKTGNIAIQGQNVTIDPGQDTDHMHDQQSSRSSGISVAVTGTPLDTMRNLKADASSGNAFHRGQGVANEIGASAGDMPSVSVSYGSTSSSSTTDMSSLNNAGSSIRGGGNVSITATGGAIKDAQGAPVDGDLAVIGSTITAGGTTSLTANRNVTLQASTDQLQQGSQSSNSSTGFSLATPSPGDFARWMAGTANSGGTSSSPYNASRSSSNGTQAQTTQTASVVTGNSVVVQSKTGDINVIGSGISGTDGVDLVAKQGAINVLAGLETNSSHQESSSGQIGSLGSNGTATGFSVGMASSHSVQDAAGQTQSNIRSQIVSGSGNVTLDAKQDLTVAGADLSAGKDLTLIGKNVNLDPGTDATQTSMSQSSSQFGVTLALGGVAGNAIAAVNQAMDQASHTKDSRLAALDVAQAGLAVENAANVAQQYASTNKTAQPLVKVTVSVGGGTSHSDSQSSALTNDGSTLHAGGTVDVVATGSGAKDANGYATDGDITARGTQISGQDVTLNAARDINLESAKDTSQQKSSNSSSGGSIGVGFGLGGQQNGFTIELAANMAKGNANGSSETNRDTQVTASNTFTMTSGRDANLRGAEVAGNTIDANVGRDLNVQSQQDTSKYDSEQASGGFQVSICVPPICYGQTVSGSASASDETIKDRYQSVGRQTGFYAGDGGFDIKVGNHTQLDGGVIASTASAEKNSLSTQTLDYANLHNESSYSGSSVGFSASAAGGKSSPDGVTFTNPVPTGNAAPGPSNSMGMGPTGFGTGGTSDSTSGTTYAAVSAGTITVRGDAGTGHDSTQGLSRDTKDANGSVANTFDAQKVQDGMALQSQTVQVGMNVAGDIAEHLEAEALGKASAAQARLNAANNAKDDVAAQQAQADLNAANADAALWSENGGAGRAGLHAIVAGIGAAMGGGNIAGALAGTIAGDMASAYLSPTLDGTLGGKLLSNIVSGAAGALVGGAVGGSAGAMSGANGALGADLYNRQYHTDKDPKQDERKTLDALEGGKSADEQQRLEDAACYMVHCADQMSDDNPAKAAALASQQRGASDTNEQGELAATGLFKYDPVVDGGLDTLGAAWDWTGPGAVRGAKNLGDQLVTKIRQGMGAQAPADDLTNASNGGTGAPPTPAVVTPSTPLMTPEGPIPGPSVAIPGSPGYVPPTATVSSGNDNSGASSSSNGASSSSGSPQDLGSNVRLYPDGSLRTPDGKFASVSGNPSPGTTASTQFADFLRSNGVNVVGEEVVVDGPLGPRRYDIVTQDADGTLHGIEVKSGNATRNTYQQFTDQFVNQFGATGTGRFFGKTVGSATTVYVP